MSLRAGRRRRKSRDDDLRRIAVDRRTGGLVRWQAGARHADRARLAWWSVIGLALVALVLTLVAAHVVGGLHWGNLLVLAPASVLVVALGAGVLALARRGLAWLAG